MRKEDAIALVSGDYGKEILKLAASFTAPIFWEQEPADNDPPKLGNGSIFFLDLGNGPFAVTAYHVYEKYCEQRELNQSIKCQIHNIEFRASERLIDFDESLDIATFKISEDEIKGIGKEINIIKPSVWPPLPPDEGKGVFYAGFPHVEIQLTGPRKLDLGIYSANGIASSITSTDVIVPIDKKHMVDTLELGLPPDDYDLGGLSGAPLFTLVENGALSWRLGGIIYAANSSMGKLHARRPDGLLSSGKIRPYMKL